MATRAVFFDVDFTLIYPGPTFDEEGYGRFADRHGVRVIPERFLAAVRAASAELDNAQDLIYRPDLFVRYARRVLLEMGGDGPGVETCAWEIYEAWAACQHFSLYDDVVPAFRSLREAGLSIGLISNTHRCLDSFQSHFALDGLIAGAVSSAEHGYLKPHPTIFEAALRLVGVEPGEAVMVGDSLTHDVEGARAVGMRGVLIARSGRVEGAGDVPVIRSLLELPPLLA